ncbi:MAG: DUF1963 domain-containing protein [Ruminococcus sp.]|nr:DUF1963 domain-containing protein [Ruminococcus sp.]MDE6784348.1 DUF1963 domain-containing protein [Ruminococcus sp.]
MEFYKDGETKPCIRLELTNRNPTIFESKAGGMGYIPHDGDFPVDKNGSQLRLLAQIECEKIHLDDFPEKGLLQFWVLNDDVSGMDWDNQTNQDGFRVIYYPEVDKTVTEEEIQSKFIKNEYDDENMMPVYGEFGLEFSESISRYYDFADEKYDDLDETPDDACGSIIGGIPYFTQTDPREYKDGLEKYDYLLFQLDLCVIQNEDGTHYDAVLWGDSGVGNFFINTEKLKNLDFSDVLYNWDCL